MAEKATGSGILKAEPSADLNAFPLLSGKFQYNPSEDSAREGLLSRDCILTWMLEPRLSPGLAKITRPDSKVKSLPDEEARIR